MGILFALQTNGQSLRVKHSVFEKTVTPKCVDAMDLPTQSLWLLIYLSMNAYST